MRYLGLDYGTKTLGLAISDVTATIATNLKVIRYSNSEELIKELSRVIEEYKVSELVLGLPLNMNGTDSTRTNDTREFKKELEDKFKIKVTLQDERLSTFEAQRMLISGNVRRDDRKKVIDSLAAVIILQTYLDKMKRVI